MSEPCHCRYLPPQNIIRGMVLHNASSQFLALTSADPMGSFIYLRWSISAKDWSWEFAGAYRGYLWLHYRKTKPVPLKLDGKGRYGCHAA